MTLDEAMKRINSSTDMEERLPPNVYAGLRKVIKEILETDRERTLKIVQRVLEQMQENSDAAERKGRDGDSWDWLMKHSGVEYVMAALAEAWK